MSEDSLYGCGIIRLQYRCIIDGCVHLRRIFNPNYGQVSCWTKGFFAVRESDMLWKLTADNDSVKQNWKHPMLHVSLNIKYQII